MATPYPNYPPPHDPEDGSGDDALPLDSSWAQREPVKPGHVLVSTVTGCRYDVLDPIAEGNFSVVYACRDIWGNDLVLKVLKDDGQDLNQMRLAAQREGSAMDAARHPMIVHIYDCFVRAGTWYIVCERCQWTLREMLDSRELAVRVDPRQLAANLLQGIDWVHRRGRMHCDIHVENVMVCAQPGGGLTYKLADFGLSQVLSDIDRRPLFATNTRPPEAIDRQLYGPIDHRVDIYHAALVLLQVLTDRIFFLSKEDILAGTPRKIAEALAHPWSAPLAQALRRHVEQRQASAERLWRDLKEASR